MQLSKLTAAAAALMRPRILIDWNSDRDGWDQKESRHRRDDDMKTGPREEERETHTERERDGQGQEANDERNLTASVELYQP